MKVKCNFLFMFIFLSAISVELGVRNERKRVTGMWENTYLSIKNPKASGLSSGLLTPHCNHALPSFVRNHLAIWAIYSENNSWPPLPDLDLLLGRKPGQ